MDSKIEKEDEKKTKKSVEAENSWMLVSKTPWKKSSWGTQARENGLVGEEKPEDFSDALGGERRNNGSGFRVDPSFGVRVGFNAYSPGPILEYQAQAH